MNFGIFRKNGNIAFREPGNWEDYESAKKQIYSYGTVNTNIMFLGDIEELLYCVWGSSANNPGWYFIVNLDSPQHKIMNHESLGEFIEW
jgi:hypothetical protein